MAQRYTQALKTWELGLVTRVQSRAVAGSEELGCFMNCRVKDLQVQDGSLHHLRRFESSDVEPGFGVFDARVLGFGHDCCSAGILKL